MSSVRVSVMVGTTTTRVAIVGRRARASEPLSTRRFIWHWFVFILFVLAMFFATIALGKTSWDEGSDSLAFKRAPMCPAARECRQDVPTLVLRMYQTKGSKGSTTDHVVVSGATDGELDLIAKRGLSKSALAPGQPATLTYWRGRVAQLRDSAANVVSTNNDPAWKSDDHGIGAIGTFLFGLLAFFYVLREWRRNQRKRQEAVAGEGLALQEPQIEADQRHRRHG